MSMHEYQAQRTLVKSRPELWAEVSDVTSLCKHLGEFGDISITRLEPETTVAWEGTAARGTVELEASGWGTKVTLTAELLDVDVDVPGPEAVPVPEPVAEVQPEPEPEPATEPEPVPAPVPVAEPAAVAVPAPDEEPVPVVPAPPQKLGFFARLFGRKPAPAPLRAVPDLDPEPEQEPEKVLPLSPPPTEPSDPITPDPNPPLVAQDARPPTSDPAPEAPRAATMDEQQAVAALTSALDDLGAAHRRPFSHY